MKSRGQHGPGVAPCGRTLQSGPLAVSPPSPTVAQDGHARQRRLAAHGGLPHRFVATAGQRIVYDTDSSPLYDGRSRCRGGPATDGRRAET